jgi:hypothetical protein
VKDSSGDGVRAEEHVEEHEGDSCASNAREKGSRGGSSRKGGLGRRIVRRIMRVLAVVVVVAACLAAGAYAEHSGLLGSIGSGILKSAADDVAGETSTLSADIVESEVKSAADLVTTRYIYKDLVKYDSTKQLFGVDIALTSDIEVYSYKGTVSLGFDLSKARCVRIDENDKIIYLSLPDVEIVANEIDANSFESIYSVDSVFNENQMGEVYSMIDELKQQHAEEALSNEELIDTTINNAQTVLTGLLTTSDATGGYSVVFVDSDAYSPDDSSDASSDAESSANADASTGKDAGTVTSAGADTGAGATSFESGSE